MALHNWYFGGVFVPFSANSTHPLVLLMPPSAYLTALVDLLRLDFGSEYLARAGRQIIRWLAGPSELAVMAPLHALALVLLARVMTRAGFDPWLRLIAGATLAQHAVSLFYVATPRYHFLSWFCTGLVAVVWFRVEGIELLRRRLPLWWERIWNNPLSRSIERSPAAVRDRERAFDLPDAPGQFIIEVTPPARPCAPAARDDGRHRRTACRSRSAA
jgi:hypothetical protein